MANPHRLREAVTQFAQKLLRRSVDIPALTSSCGQQLRAHASNCLLRNKIANYLFFHEHRARE
jgi:hypothetical protein